MQHITTQSDITGIYARIKYVKQTTEGAVNRAIFGMLYESGAGSVPCANTAIAALIQNHNTTILAESFTFII